MSDRTDTYRLRTEFEPKGLKDANESYKELVIRVKELDYLRRTERITNDQLQQKLGEVSRASDKVSLSYKQQVDLSAQMYQVTQRAEAGFKSLAVTTEGMNNMVRTARQEHRLYMFGLMELTRTMEGMTGPQKRMIDGIRTGAEAALGMKFAMEAMGVAAGVSGPIALVIGAFAALNTILKNDNEEMDKLYVKQLKLRITGGLISKEDQVRSLTTEKIFTEQARAKLIKEEEKRAEEEKKAEKGNEAYGVGEAAPFQKSKVIVELDNRLIEIGNELKDLNKDILSDEKKISDEKAKQFESSLQAFQVGVAFRGKNTTWASLIGDRRSLAEKFGLKFDKKEAANPFDPNSTDVLLGGGGFRRVSVPEAPQDHEELSMKGEERDLRAIGRTTSGPLTGAFKGLGSMLESEVIQKLGKANSLLQGFVQGFVSGIIQMSESLLSKAALFGFLSLISGGTLTAGTSITQFMGLAASGVGEVESHDRGGMIMRPTLGVDTSGQLISIAEHGPEGVINANGMGPRSGWSGQSTITVNVQGKIGHDAIYISSLKGRTLASVSSR